MREKIANLLTHRHPHIYNKVNIYKEVAKQVIAGPLAALNRVLLLHVINTVWSTDVGEQRKTAIEIL